MLKLKAILNDVVEYAYGDDPRLPRYKKFYVEYLKKKLKTKNGDYREDNHHLRIFTEGRDSVSVLKTSLHELSHHVDCMQRGHSCHDARFYSIYKQLLFAALDMGIFDREEYVNCYKDSRDAGKVMKMLDSYQPKESGYKKGMLRISVRRAYDIREHLKGKKYTYNSYDKSWEKEVSKESLKREEAYLKDLGADYMVEDARHLAF